MTALLLGPAEQAALRVIRERAAAHPIDMLSLPGSMESEQGRAAHRAQMTSQTVEIPVHYIVTYSVEIGHPCGPCRHMSMSAPRAGRIPNPPAVWSVAEELGFVGGFERCAVWVEELVRGTAKAEAVNVVQPIGVVAERETGRRYDA
jgi:hypothetical protein